MLAQPATAATRAGGDFDGDGFADLAIGAPAEDLTFELEADAGVVHVIYGSAKGLRADVSDVITDDLTGGDTEEGDTFGTALAAGDFDGDGFDDLAIGVPSESVDPGGGNVFRAGAVRIVPGSRHGLRPARGYGFTQQDLGLTVEADDFFGNRLVAGRFDAGKTDDLAVGTTNESIEAEGADEAGIVSVFYGSATGLSADGAETFNQGDVGEEPDDLEHFGSALAAGELGRGGLDELIIGVPDEYVDFGGSAVPRAGVIHVLRGRPGGLDGADSELISRATPGIAGAPGLGDRFGLTLATADFGRDSHEDLAVGAPTDQQGTDERRGSVNVLYGSRKGINAKGDQVFSQASPKIAGAPADGDFFGLALAAGDLGRGGKADLAVGVPGEATPTSANSALRGGAVAVIYGTPGGLSAVGNRLFSQETPGVADSAEAGEHFGEIITIGDFGRSPQADLAIGVFSEDVGLANAAGIVQVLYGAAKGLSAKGDQLWSQLTVGGDDVPEAIDAFGAALGVG